MSNARVQRESSRTNTKAKSDNQDGSPFQLFTSLASNISAKLQHLELNDASADALALAVAAMLKLQHLLTVRAKPSPSQDPALPRPPLPPGDTVKVRRQRHYHRTSVPSPALAVTPSASPEPVEVPFVPSQPLELEPDDAVDSVVINPYCPQTEPDDTLVVKPLCRPQLAPDFTDRAVAAKKLMAEQTKLGDIARAKTAVIQNASKSGGSVSDPVPLPPDYDLKLLSRKTDSAENQAHQYKINLDRQKRNVPFIDYNSGLPVILAQKIVKGYSVASYP
jgi:hypothetical protein